MNSSTEFTKFGDPYIEEIKNYLGKKIAWHVVWFEKVKGKHYPELQYRNYTTKAEAQAMLKKVKASAKR